MTAALLAVPNRSDRASVCSEKGGHGGPHLVRITDEGASRGIGAVVPLIFLDAMHQVHPVAVRLFCSKSFLDGRTYRARSDWY